MSKSKRSFMDLGFSRVTGQYKNKATKLKCNFCKTVLPSCSAAGMKRHRLKCDVIAIKRESSTNNGMSLVQINSNEEKEAELHKCFICNDEMSSSTENPETKRSRHSETRICDLIRKCLGDCKIHRNIEDDINGPIICSDCSQKIDVYDLACATADRVSKELRQLLLHTDSLYVINGSPPMKDMLIRSEDAIVAEDDANSEVVEVMAEPIELETNADFDEVANEATDFSDSGSSCNKESTIKEDTNLKNDSKKKRIYECDVCPKKFDLWRELRMHRREHRNEEVRFRCDICNFDPKDANALTEHKELHIGLSPLQCVICKKTFGHKRNIRPHMRLHTGQKKYQCDRCGKEYFHKSSFSLHMAYHDGIRTLKCPHCTRQFMVKCDLEKHIRIHTGEKPYKCGVCDKRFARCDNMREHQRIHDKHPIEKPYLCSFSSCDAAFARRSKLNKHLEKHGVAIQNEAGNGPQFDRIVEK